MKAPTRSVFASSSPDVCEAEADDGLISPIRGRLRRLSTDFAGSAEGNDVQSVGPWRTTTVERRASNPWLLIGRRHSVDDRRSSMEESKLLFLGVMSAQVGKGSARRCQCTATAEEVIAIESRLQEEIACQTAMLDAAMEFWLKRQAADEGYISQLEGLASLARGVPSTAVGSRTSAAPAYRTPTVLTPQLRQEETEWRACVQQAADRSANMAAQLPRFVEQHASAVAQIRRGVAGVIESMRLADAEVETAQAAVWPKDAKLFCPLPGERGWDAIGTSTGSVQCDHSTEMPRKPCCWLQSRRYLVACSRLEQAQCTALSRLHREEKRLALLGEWLQRLLESCSSSQVHSPPSLSSLESSSVCDSNAISKTDGEPGQNFLDTDLSALVVHQVVADISVTSTSNEECNLRDATNGTGKWANGCALLSSDLWLHVWTADKGRDREQLLQLPSNGPPGLSISLVCQCARPVAELVRDEDDERQTTRILQFHFNQDSKSTEEATVVRGTRPVVAAASAAVGALVQIGAELILPRWTWTRTALGADTPGPPARCWQTLQLRCEDEAAAEHLLAALGLVEQLYPVATISPESRPEQVSEST